MNTELQTYRGDILNQAKSWAELSAEDLKRRAAKAANERDTEELWQLTKAYLFLHGAKGGNVSSHTLRNYRRGVTDLIESWQGENILRPSRDAGVLYVRKLETVPNQKTGQPVSAATIEVKLAAARTLYKALRWTDATEANPFEDVSPAPDMTPDWEKRKPYTVEDVEKLLHVAEPLEAVMVLLGAHTGLRISEICSLKWSDIDWSKGKLKVLGKGGKRASVSMSAKLEEILKSTQTLRDERKRTKNSSDHVLPWQPDRARQRFKQLCSLAGVEYKDKAVHGLRHGAGTRYYAQTKDLGRVASHLRHENIQTTRIYAKLADDAIREDLKDW
jgi:integrase/recombinase XerC